jgi:iron complex outermembrane receptor protein
MKSLRTTASLLLLAVSAAGPLAAQHTEPGSIRGQVRDESGIPLAEATITAITELGISRMATTDAAGHYTIPSLPPGTYTVRARLIGHRPVERTARQLRSAGELAMDFTLDKLPIMLTSQVVTATRSASSLSDIPGAVSVVGREALEEQSAVSNSLGAVLGRAVPGFGPATGTPSLHGQALRGRDVSVLIDGVPLSTARSVGRDLMTIDPAMIERVEVLRGASAVYGDGATGGVINIITRTPGDGRPRFTTDLRTSGSLSAPGNGGGLRVAQSIAGQAGRLDYSAGGSIDRAGANFDAEGDRIPADPNGQGGLSDLDAWDGFGKFGLSLGQQRFQLTLNHYTATQNTDYATAPIAAGDTLTEPKSSAIPGLALETPQNHVNSLASLDYTHESVAALMGSRVHAQLYGRDYYTRFGPSGRTLVRPSTGSSTPQQYMLQSFVDSWKVGGRLELQTSVPRLRDGSVTWGVDYNRERTYQGLNHFDKAAYDASGGLAFRKIDEWYWVPPMNIDALGLFAQAAWRPIEPLMLRGGVRHERDRARVDDFSTIEEVQVTGGTLRYDPTVFNAGAVLTAGRGVDVYANFSQGFSLGDLGRILRQAPPGFTLGSHSTEAQRVDQWEYGARGLWSRVQATLSYFRSSSELGTQIDTAFHVLRAPERIHGFEATLDLQPTAHWELGGTFTWTEGDFLDPADDEWKALNSFRIAPPKTTAYVQHRTLERWTNRVQLVVVGSRDRAALDDIGYGGRPVRGYTTVDYVGTLGVGPGALSLGVENIFNRLYYPLPSQLMASGSWTGHTAARGAVLSIGYRVNY